MGLLNSLRSASTHTTDIDTFVLSWCMLYLVLTNPPSDNQSSDDKFHTYYLFFLLFKKMFRKWKFPVRFIRPFFSYLHFVYNWFWYVISVVSCLKCYSSYYMIKSILIIVTSSMNLFSTVLSFIILLYV